jgi:hypothetical protein
MFKKKRSCDSSIRHPSPPPTNRRLQRTLQPRATRPSPPLSLLAVPYAIGMHSSSAPSLKYLPLPTLQEDSEDSDDRSPNVPNTLPAPSQSSRSSHGHTCVRPSPSRTPTSTGELAPPTAPPTALLTKELVPFLLLPLRLRWWFPKRAPDPPVSPTRKRSWWPKRPLTIASGTGKGVLVTATAKPSKPKAPHVRAKTDSAATPNVPPSRSSTGQSTLLPILTPIRLRVPVSDEVLGFLTGAANDPESLLRPAKNGTVSAGNLEGFLSRVIAGSADSSRDERFKAAFLTIYQLFATSERVFEILKRRFESTSVDPTVASSRYL